MWRFTKPACHCVNVGRQNQVMYRGADKSLARPGRKQATTTEDFSFIYPIYNHNWGNISTIYVYNKTSIKRNILTIKQIHRKVGRAKDLSAPRYSRKYCPLEHVMSFI